MVVVPDQGFYAMSPGLTGGGVPDPLRQILPIGLRDSIQPEDILQSIPLLIHCFCSPAHRAARHLGAGGRRCQSGHDRSLIGRGLPLSFNLLLLIGCLIRIEALIWNSGLLLIRRDDRGWNKCLLFDRGRPHLFLDLLRRRLRLGKLEVGYLLRLAQRLVRHLNLYLIVSG